MEFSKKSMVMFVVFLATLQVTMGVVYKVGDSAGWTIIGSPDYKKWASSKTFRVGDIVLFQYNSQFHNVMQVTQPDFNSCNASAPITTHTTGNDSITLRKSGHYYYLCGVPGHCKAGQKVDIKVLATSSSSMPPSTAPTGSTPTGSTPTGTTPLTSPAGSTALSPNAKGNAPLLSTGAFSLVAAFSLAVFAGFAF